MNPEVRQTETAMERWSDRILKVWLVACVLGFAVVSLRWPLVGDVTYLHYAIFLMHHGMVPYRQIADMNLPGAYMLEGAVMASLGAGAIGWRVYDFILMAIAAVSMLSILRPYGRLAGVFAACLFAMVHAQDGEIMSGERDFAVAVFLLAAIALVFQSFRRVGCPYGFIFGFGVLLSAAVCVKPTVAPLALGLAIWVGLVLHRRSERVKPEAAAALAGLLLPVCATIVFLVRHHATLGFAEALRGLIPYHASLAHKSVGFLIGHSVAPLAVLSIVWVFAIVLNRHNITMDPERIALLICAIGGLVSYLLQTKGFAYQRYPFLAFLLVLMAADFVRLARIREAVRIVGIAGLLAGAIFCTIFFVRTLRFDRGAPAQPLLRDLRELGVADGQVQCMDTSGSCIDNLYAGRIVQSTGFLYDCYMLDGTNPVALGLRRRFWDAMERNTPRLIVVTNSVCYDPVPSFDKYGRWPEFSEFLAAHYTLEKTSGIQEPVRHWSRAVTPFAYRIYVRR